MSDSSLSSWFRRSGAVRWGACFALAIGFHGAGAAALLARWTDDNALLPNSPAIMIDLAPMAVAPTTTPSDAPPDQVESKEMIEPDPQPEKPIEETKVEPEPEKPPEKVEQPPDNSPKPELAVVPPPKPEKPKPKPKPKKMASVARTPSSAENHADRAAAPSPGANGNPNAVPSWMSQLFSHLERYKRYPSDGGGNTGVVQLAFSIDRSGGVHGARIIRSSGSGALDQAALSLVARASPLPPPPPEKPGASISISVPIRYKPN